MPDKIAILTVAFRERNFIQACIKQFAGFELRHLIVCSNTPWHGHHDRDDTYNIARKSGADAVLYNFSSDAQQRNYGLRYLQSEGYDWALIVDADEFYTQENINKLLNSLSDRHNVVRAPNMSVYWKTPEYLINPDPQPDLPIVAIKTDQKFSWSRLSDANLGGLTDAHFHHLSYVRSNYDMRVKMDISEHTNEVVPNWYNDVWMTWTPEKINLHPVVPHQFASTSYKPVPNEIRSLL